MSLDKGIKYGKEHRKQYINSKFLVVEIMEVVIGVNQIDYTR